MHVKRPVELLEAGVLHVLIHHLIWVQFHVSVAGIRLDCAHLSNIIGQQRRLVQVAALLDLASGEILLS